jgi:putative endonuclease
MFYVYVLKSPVHGQIYIGYTADLRQRFREHQKIERHKGWILIYYEAYRDEQDARDRERMLKHYGGTLGILKKRIKRSMDLSSELAGEARCPSPRECRP